MLPQESVSPTGQLTNFPARQIPIQNTDSYPIILFAGTKKVTKIRRIPFP